MRITFGIHRNKKVEDVAEDDLRSLLEWIDRLEDPTPSQKKDYDRQAQAIRHELSKRSDEREDDAQRVGPMTVLAHMTGSTAKLLLGFFMIRAASGGADPFPASTEDITKATGLSPRAITESKRELVDYGVLSTFTRGDYRLNLESADSADSQYLVQFLKSTTRSEEETRESAESADYTSADVTDAATVALKILSPGVEPMDSVVRYSRTRLKRLLAQGVTLAEAMLVVRWARRTWETSDARFAPMLDLTYIWTDARFAGYLAAAKSGPAKKSFSVMDTPEEEQQAQDELTAKLKRKGLV